MGKLQDIIRYLEAAGGTPSRDGKTTYFTYEKEGSIWMRIWSGSELSDDVLVADGVRPGTSAPIVNRSQKKVFVVHGDDSIKCFMDRLGDSVQVDELDDDEPWDEEEIAGVDTQAHPQSQLAVSYDKNTVFVFYQKPDGTLGCINEHNNQWKDVKLPAVDALEGTPLATCNTNYAVFLFYISTDGTVRYLENREGKWNDVFFSAAKIIDPNAGLPGSAYKLTVAEDRQPFERIRPMVFCLINKVDENILSIIRCRSKRLEELGGVVQGTEFVPSPGINMERHKYYFWSPYPFYTMIKRRARNLTQATISKELWNQGFNLTYPQQDRGSSSAMEHLGRFQKTLSAPTVNKTLPIVCIEPTIAHATIPPQTPEQREISSGIPARRAFPGFGIIDPLTAIRRGMRYFGSGRNELAAEQDAPNNREANHLAITNISPETAETDMSEMESEAIGSIVAEPSWSELEEPENAELSIEQSGADTALATVDRLEEADSDSAEESGSEGTESAEVETAPSEVETGNEEDQSQKVQPQDQGEEHQSLNVQTEEAQAKEHQPLPARLQEAPTEESENEETDNEEFEDEESEDDESEDQERNEELQKEEPRTKEPRTEEQQAEDHQVEDRYIERLESQEIQIEGVQDEEIQSTETQLEKVQAKNLPNEEAQTKDLQNDYIQGFDPELGEYEPKISTIGAFEPERELENVEWRGFESNPESDEARAPTETSTTSSTEKPFVMNPYATEMYGQEADVGESGFKYPDPKESKRTENPTVDKGKDPAAADTPSSRSRFSSPQDIQDDMYDHIEKNNLGGFYPKDSDYVRTLANNAFDYKENKANLLNRDEEIRGITLLNLYQPVLYCDDSTSMNASSRFVGHKGRTRVEDQKEVVRRVARVSTSVVPPGHGTSLQFINHARDIYDNKLNLRQVEAIMDSVKPSGHTEIGKYLKAKILKPLVYDVIKSDRRLERPILVSCITDGCPSDRNPKRFKEEILKCTQFLEANGYPRSTIKFQLSQIGNSSRAREFLDELRKDTELSGVLYCTAQHLDEQFSDLRDNETNLERWLLRTLLEPIMGREVNNLNLY